MTVLIFILVLVALIVVHELGHFFAAKWSGMRVDEFGIGYPPRALTLWKHNGTEYTLNWLPFGGFVKIYGEDDSMPAPADGSDPVKSNSFVAKPHWQQALVLIAGIAMNLLFAWLLLSATLAIGLPRGLADADIRNAPDASLMISRVVEGTPAFDAGLQVGDRIKEVVLGDERYVGAYAEAFTSFINTSKGEPVSLSIERAGETLAVTVTPKQGVVPADIDRYALGVGIGAVGTVQVPLLEAPLEGAVLTWEVTKQVAVGLVTFFGGLFTFSADLSQVSGPIGIAGAVGDASATSLAALLSLTAVISINLALINIIPVPALDGGRLLFVGIEAITRKPIPAGIANTLNTAGFALLILLMVVVTASDLWKALV